MTCYAVIDTNVLIASLLTSHEDSATVQILEKVFTGEIIPLYNQKIIEEYQNVLHRKKFGFSNEAIFTLLGALVKFGELVAPLPSGEILPNKFDLPFYEVALARQNDHAFLVTGNLKHFPLKSFIVTPRELISLLKSLDKK